MYQAKSIDFQPIKLWFVQLTESVPFIRDAFFYDNEKEINVKLKGRRVQ
jgi:hypothetical protein